MILYVARVEAGFASTHPLVPLRLTLANTERVEGNQTQTTGHPAKRPAGLRGPGAKSKDLQSPAGLRAYVHAYHSRVTLRREPAK